MTASSGVPDAAFTRAQEGRAAPPPASCNAGPGTLTHIDPSLAIMTPALDDAAESARAFFSFFLRLGSVLEDVEEEELACFLSYFPPKVFQDCFHMKNSRGITCTLDKCNTRSAKLKEGITGHSLKSTTLDWSGKFGLSDSHQTVVGHHSLKGSTMYVYMRDKLASTLREYERMFGAIRHGLFLPDATRSGMLAPAKSSDMPDTSENQGPALSAEACDSPSDMARRVIAEAFGDQEPGDAVSRGEETQSAVEDTDSSESSSSSSESSDESSPETDWVDKYSDGIANAVRRDRVNVPEISHWRHKRTMTIHSMAKGAVGSTFTCGRKCTSDYFVITESAFLESRLCTVCKKRKPIRDVGALVAMVDQKLSA